MDAIELLKKDHRKVSELFKQAEAAEGEARKEQLFEKIKTELETHTHIEETVFYPALERHEELKDLVLEAYEEHKQVKTLIREIGQLVEGSEKFDAKLKVMGENVEHHVEEEEEEMFPKVRKLMSATQLGQLGKELEEAKQSFAKSSARSTAR
ncbi:MAG TPA: hemerythrin domain-containing protein [Blastocatellia bacterium]|jgi:hemerythrin superfamily protein|nr:hemerythrin domain-containing protein [Blastocatellia bacterium]